MVNIKKSPKNLIVFPSFELVTSWVSALVSADSRKKIIDTYKELIFSEIYLGVHHAKFPVIYWETLHACPDSSTFNAPASIKSYFIDKYLALNKELISDLPIRTASPLSILTSTACEKEIVIVVPPNTRLDMPLEYFTTLGNNQRLFEKIYFIIGAQSKVAIVDTLKSAEPQNYAFTGRAITCIVEENAELEYVFLNYCGDSVVSATTIDIIAKKNALATIFCGAVGGSVTIIDATLHCIEAGAEINNGTVYAIGNNQQLSLATYQLHDAPTTKSHVQIKGIVRDQAYSNYDGSVSIAHCAPHSSAHQESAVLLLSPHAKARATPALEVQTQEVQCSHGSALGIINSEYYIYLQARGIEQSRAEQMVLEGYIAPLIALLLEATTNCLLTTECLKELQRRCYGQ